MPIHVYDGARNLIVQVVGDTIQSDLQLFDVTTLVPVPRTLVLQKANFSIMGPGSIMLVWEGVTNTDNALLLFMSGGGPGELNFYRWGGTPNTSPNPTGNVHLNTVGLETGDGYTVTMEFTKNLLTDPNMVLPGAVTGAAAVSDDILQNAVISWTMPAAPTSTTGARVYRSRVNDFATAIIVGSQGGAPGAAVSFSDYTGVGGKFFYWVESFNAVGNKVSPPIALAAVSVNLVSNGNFDAGSTGWAVGTAPGWTFANGIATKAPTGTASSRFYQTVPLVASSSYSITYTVLNYTAGLVRCRFLDANGGNPVNGTGRTANGVYTETLVAGAGSVQLDFFGNGPFGGSVDNISIKEV
jgi:hypothetical protein